MEPDSTICCPLSPNKQLYSPHEPLREREVLSRDSGSRRLAGQRVRPQGTALILKWGLAQLERHCLIKMQGSMAPMMCESECVCALREASIIRADCCHYLLPCLLMQLAWTIAEMRPFCCPVTLCLDIHLLSYISKVINLQCVLSAKW